MNVTLVPTPVISMQSVLTLRAHTIVDVSLDTMETELSAKVRTQLKP